MFCYKVGFDLVLICCLCSLGMSVWVGKTRSTPSFIVGGNPNYDIENDLYEMNCSQFIDDMDILRQLPFRIRVDPDDDETGVSVAQLYDDMKTVRMITLINEKLLPSSLFCLSKLDDLSLYRVTLKDNALPEGVTKLQTLTELCVTDVPNLKIGDQLSKLTNLSTLSLTKCSLTSLPDVSHLNFILLDVKHNNLSHFKGAINTAMLSIDNNSFRSLPILSNPEKIVFLTASHNPLTSILPVLKYKNLRFLSASNANITFIPPDIDRLEKLSMIDLSNNKLTHLPINILNLPKLEHLDVSSNRFSPIQIRSIKKTIENHYSDLEFNI